MSELSVQTVIGSKEPAATLGDIETATLWKFQAAVSLRHICRLSEGFGKAPGASRNSIVITMSIFPSSTPFSYPSCPSSISNEVQTSCHPAPSRLQNIPPRAEP